VLTFADPEVIRMARDEFVPVAADDWYQRRRQDAEGEFFRGVADQGPRKGAGGSTRQGIYVFTAGGKLLAYRNHQDPAVMRGVLKQALHDWRKLPEGQGKAGAVEVADAGKVDAAYARTPPPGALVVNVYTRILDRTAGGAFCHGICKFAGGDRAARDHLWLTEAEWKALIPASPREGETVSVPRAVAYRIARFHLCDNTRGEPPAWGRAEVRSLKLTLTVADVNDAAVTLRLDGSVLLATAADAAKSGRGFDARLLGWLRYDRKKQIIDRLDAVVLGEHWGESRLTRGARPGRTPLGVAFELSRGDPADRVPPQGARWLPGYLNADKQ
jgi:hypothetical protein